MNIETIEVCGFPGVLKALRKPFKKEMRSTYNIDVFYGENTGLQDIITKSSTIRIHPEDIKLMSKLVKAGDEHSKALRGLIVYADFELPRYIWSEFDTYRIGKECLSSESTMHTILNEDITENNFDGIDDNISDMIIDQFIDAVDTIKQSQLPNKIKKLSIKSILPESYLQTRTLMLSYQALRRIYFQRRHHELPIWKSVCNWIKELPYSKELITIE